MSSDSQTLKRLSIYHLLDVMKGKLTAMKQNRLDDITMNITEEDAKVFVKAMVLKAWLLGCTKQTIKNIAVSYDCCEECLSDLGDMDEEPGFLEDMVSMMTASRASLEKRYGGDNGLTEEEQAFADDDLAEYVNHMLQ